MRAVARLALLIVAATVSCAFGATAPSPQDFAYGIAIVSAADAAVYRIAIPAEVYQKAVRPDLADIQVFNARGEAVPYAIEQPLAPPNAHLPGRSLPLFPLRDDSPAALNAVRVSIASPGSAISLQTHSSDAASAGAISYVLDAQGLDAPVAAIQLRWPQGAADYAGRIRVEAADTLGLWHTVVASSPIANLHSSGAQLIEDRIELPATRAKFWRLSWVGTPPAFALESAVAEPAAEQLEDPEINRDTHTVQPP